jgi:LysM repeat protein
MLDETFPIDSTWKDSNINIKIKDVRLNVIQNGNNIDIKITIYVEITVENILNISSIEKIEDTPIDLKDISSINIYVVKPGDSIWKIAKKYKTSMENIIKTNKLENPDLINIGQKILVIR